MVEGVMVEGHMVGHGLVVVVVVSMLGASVGGCDVLCKNPYVRDNVKKSDALANSGNLAAAIPFGCGQCLPCRINRSRVWTHRLLLEQMAHDDSVFITLTYNDNLIPDDFSLHPQDFNLFLKRLRHHVYPSKIRYFGVGEYGDHTERPHYHAAIFGLSYSDTQIIEKAWNKGYVQVGDLNKDSARYITGYVTKGLTKKDHVNLHGRHPEFARMSNRPGIGAFTIDKIAANLQSDGRFEKRLIQSLKHGKHNLPLGRYLENRLSNHLGTQDEKVKRFGQYAESLLQEPLWSDSIVSCLKEKNKGKHASLEARDKIRNSKRRL